MELQAAGKRKIEAIKDYGNDFLELKYNLIELRDIVTKAPTYTKRGLVDSLLTVDSGDTSSIDGLIWNLKSLISRKA